MNTELSIHDGKYYYFLDFAWSLFFQTIPGKSCFWCLTITKFGVRPNYINIKMVCVFVSFEVIILDFSQVPKITT
jgi:hypothetical protein